MKTKKIALSLFIVIALFISGSLMVPQANLNYVIAEETTDEAVETPAPKQDPDPPSIIIQNVPASLTVGETAQLATRVKNTDDDINWKSDNEGIMTVDSVGKITAKAPGTAKITATTGKASDSVKITVKQVEAESIKIVSDDLSFTGAVTGYEIKKGDTIKLGIEVSPKEAVVEDIIWEVNDETIAQIDEGGTLIGLEKGEVIVTATSKDDKDLSTDITIKVGTTIPWAMIAIVAVIAIIIIILISLIIRKKMRENRRPQRRSRKYDDDDDDYDDDDEDDVIDTRDAEAKKRQEMERLRREAYEQGYKDRDKEMTRVFDPKDFDFKDDDID